MIMEKFLDEDLNSDSDSESSESKSSKSSKNDEIQHRHEEQKCLQEDLMSDSDSCLVSRNDSQESNEGQIPIILKTKVVEPVLLEDFSSDSGSNSSESQEKEPVRPKTNSIPKNTIAEFPGSNNQIYHLHSINKDSVQNSNHRMGAKI